MTCYHKEYRVSRLIHLPSFLFILLTFLLNIPCVAESAVNPQIAVGLYHTVALKSDGTIWAWGDNEYGQLGDGNTTQRLDPQQVPGLTGVVAIAAGNAHTVALKSDGTVWTWGFNGFGQLGSGNTNGNSSPTKVNGLSGVTAIAAGGDGTAAIRVDGTLYVWGRNDFNQIGDGTSTHRSTPVPINSLAGVTGVALAQYHTIAVLTSGSVWAWGDNIYGQLGNGTTTGSPLPQAVSGLAGVVAVGAGDAHSVALKGDGTVWAWGDNQDYQLGDGTTTSQLLPQQVPGISNIAAVAAAGLHTIVQRFGGTVWAWGDNDFGQLGNGTTTPGYTPVQVLGVAGIGTVATSYFHTAAIRNNGEIWMWGDNDLGQLGNGTTSAHTTSFLVSGLSGMTAVAAGAGHSVALKDDGTVLAWGDNQFGQLDNSDSVRRIYPATVTGLIDMTAIAAGEAHTVARKADGTVWTWGANQFGQLGDGATVNLSTPEQVPGLVDVTAISAGLRHTVALRSDGTVWAWGANGNGQLGDGTMIDRSSPTRVNGLSGIVAIAAGYWHTVAVKSDGTVWAWGYNGAGQLGDGTVMDRADPVQVLPPSGIVAVAAGGFHTLALRGDGTVLVWGHNGYGQVGDGSASDILSPTQLLLTNVTAVAAGYFHSVIVRSDGSVWSWGLNDDGQLGNGTISASFIPIQVPGLADVTAVSAGERHTLAVLGDGTVRAWGSNSLGQVGDPRDLSPQLAVGINAGTYPPVTVATPPGGTYPAPVEVSLQTNKAGTVYYTLDGSTPTPSSNVYNTPITISSTTTLSYFAVDASGIGETVKTDSYSFAPDYALTVTITGSVGGRVDYSTGTTCTGACSKLFTSGTNITLTPVPDLNVTFSGWTGCDVITGDLCSVTMTEAKNITASFQSQITPMTAAGENHVVVLKSDGTVLGWGYNADGQVGDGTTTTRHTPVPVGLTAIASVATSYMHTLALKADGTVWAWGLNNYGQVGDGSTASPRRTPVQVQGLSGVTSVAAGDYHSIALKSDGTVWVWGYNNAGQLGDGTTTNRLSPTQVPGLQDIVAISAGGGHSMALRSDGSIWTWGSNGNGQIGSGASSGAYFTSPVKLSGVAGAIAISAGRYHSVAVRDDGTVWGWGWNGNGELGDGTAVTRYTPVRTVGMADVYSVEAGVCHTVALKNDGTAWGWGCNGLGQLGDGTSVSHRRTPVKLANLSGITALAAGGYHTHAIKNDGTVWGWGFNGYGNVGDGTTTNRTLPVTTTGINAGLTIPVTKVNPEDGTYGSPITVTLRANEPATIYYTTNGLDPVTSPTRFTYLRPLLIPATTTLKYYAVDHAAHLETVETREYVINDITPPVTTASLSGGTYGVPQTVVLTANEPATIYYTTNGLDPSTSPTKRTYTGPLTVSVSTTLKYYAQDLAGNSDTVKTATFVITPPVTTVSTPGGTYAAPQMVTLTANQPATIYYTTNGIDPATTAAFIYSGPLVVSVPTTLKYFAKVAGGASEAVKTSVYTINPPITTVSPLGGTYSTPQSVTLTANQPATIYYTTNGIDPTVTASFVYSGPLLVSEPTTLKYFARVTGGLSEAVKAANYIIKQNQTITFGPLPPKRYLDPIYTISSIATSGLPVSYASSNPAVVTVSGNTVTIVGVGTTIITASQGGNEYYNPAPDVVQTLTVNKAIASVTLSNTSTTYDGTPKAATAASVPAGLIVSLTYDGSSTPPVAAGNYAVSAAIDDLLYEGTVSGTFTILKADQTITFAAPSPTTYGAAPFTLTATATSGLAVGFASSNPAVVTVSGNVVTVVGAGTATITASQAGDGNYNAAPAVPQPVTVNKATATVTLSGLSTTYDGGAKAAVVTTSPAGLPVTITYNGSSTAPTAVGTYSVLASVNHANYEGSATGSLIIDKGNQTIAFAAVPQKMVGDVSFALTATATSGLAITYTSSNPGVATVSGNVVTIIAAGTTTLTASQTGDGNYYAATPVTRTLTVVAGYDPQGVRLTDNGTTSYFGSFSAASNAILSGVGTEMRLMAGVLTEIVVFDKPYSVSVKGGYDTSLATVTGETIIRGSMTISNGTISIEGPLSVM